MRLILIQVQPDVSHDEGKYLLSPKKNNDKEEGRKRSNKFLGVSAFYFLA